MAQREPDLTCCWNAAASGMQASLLKVLWEMKNNEANWTKQTNKHKRCKTKTKTKNPKGISQLHFNELLFLLYVYILLKTVFQMTQRIKALWPIPVKKNSQHVLYSNKTVYLRLSVSYLAEISVLGDVVWHDSMQKWGTHSFYILQLFLTALNRTVSSIYQLSFIFIFHVSR